MNKINKQTSIFVFIIILILPIMINAQGLDYKKGELLVKFKPGISEKSILTENKFSEMNVKIKRRYPNLGVYLVSFDDSFRSDQEVLARFKGDTRINAAQFNHPVQLRSTTPNDQYFSNQWSLHNTGQTGGTSGADVSAPEAWDITTGESGTTATNDEIITAVVDAGFDLDHEDLNFTELVYNVAEESEEPADMPVSEHGTIVAGIIGAIGNNSTGVSGIGWNNMVLPIGDIFDPDTLIYKDNVVAAYEYILDLGNQYNQSNGQEGLFIVATNSSFGLDHYVNGTWVGTSDPQDHQVWCDLYDELGEAGILNVAATVNQNIDVDEELDVPSACSSDYLITVTNTDDDDNKYVSGDPYLDGAAWGETTVDLGAPGTRIYTTLINDDYGIDYGSFQYTSGTSFATPHVTGTIPLIYNILPEDLLTYYESYPEQAPLDIKDAILNSVDPNSSLQGNTPTVTGGRLNVFNALKYVIEHYGADLGRNMNEVVFTDEMTIQNAATKITLHSDLTLEEDLNIAGGASLTLDAKSIVTISASSGTVTIGGSGTLSKSSSKDSNENDDSKEPLIANKYIPEEFQLSQNFPNPFNSITVINYSLPTDEKVKIVVYDLLGREIAELVNGFKEAGEYSITFDASKLSSGIYFYRINAGKFTQSRKLIITK